MGVLSIQNLTRDYGGGRGVFDLSFAVAAGEAFGFLGPNGAGKTTTIRHLMGFIRPEAGRCSVGGLDCWREAAKIQGRLGYIPGEIGFFDDMSGTEFLQFTAKYRGQKSDGRTKELLERFELNPKGKIKKMSKGMKQKVGIVAAFMHDPEILLLDEPTGGLDPLMQNRFIDLVAEEKARGKTILLSSHMFEEVERCCDRVGIIRAGKLVTVDATEALRSRHMETHTVTLDTEEEAAAFAADFHGRQTGRKVTVVAMKSLEEIFLHYYGGEKSC
ncbi:MAG: ABC transporter ATP-binding protein [Oscillospiraceae bacterium]|jgi:ABC-2 type transport system ATP-binding protein|nr:ABC transporter ATP-binding protein [Oscillospiraceae bacterium]